MTEDEQKELLKTLRDENAKRWKHLKELHRQQQQQQQQQPAAAAAVRLQHRSVGDFLRTEFDLLPQSELAVESNAMVELLKKQKSEIAPNDKYAAEIVRSYHDLRVTNAVLKMNIDHEEDRLKKIKGLKEQQMEIMQELNESFKVREDETMDLEGEQGQSATDVPTTQLITQDEENKILKDNLRYVVECIEMQRKLQTEADNAIAQDETEGYYWSLDKLVLELIDRLLSSSPPANDHPYLSVDSPYIKRDHVELLRQYYMIEEFDEEDSNLIRLIEIRELAGGVNCHVQK